MEHFPEILFERFEFNYMKINSDESHFFFSRDDIVSTNVYNNSNNAITSENKNRLLGLCFGPKTLFEDHINSLCK